MVSRFTKRVSLLLDVYNAPTPIASKMYTEVATSTATFTSYYGIKFYFVVHRAQNAASPLPLQVNGPSWPPGLPSVAPDYHLTDLHPNPTKKS